MTTPPPIRVIAGTVALSAFAVACVAGLGAGLDAASILTRALYSMAGGYALGVVLGWAAGRAIRDHAEAMRRQRPVPDVKLPDDQEAAGDAQEPRSPHDPTPETDEEAQPRAAA